MKIGKIRRVKNTKNATFDVGTEPAKQRISVAPAEADSPAQAHVSTEPAKTEPRAADPRPHVQPQVRIANVPHAAGVANIPRPVQSEQAVLKKTLAATAVCLVAILLTCGIGCYSVAYSAKRKVPVYCVDRADGYVSISFDAAWGADKTRQIMDVCDAYGVKATFFLVGFWMDRYPEMVQEIAERGFEIGTHSATHPQMSKLSAAECRNELESSCQKIRELTGRTVTLFRAPFGDYNNTLLDVCDSLGLIAVQWSVDSLDWKGYSAQQIATRVQRAQSGDIILCHNNSDHILEALPLVFEWARMKGLKFCPIGQLIYTQNYTIDSAGKQHAD